MYTYPSSRFMMGFTTPIQDIIKLRDTTSKHLDNKAQKNLHNKCVELLELIGDLKLADWDIYNISTRQQIKKFKFQDSMKNNSKETRDNKGVYVGSGGSNRNSIRYPKKARSKKTWAMFYSMFPYTAKADGWDGKTSSKMK